MVKKLIRITDEQDKFIRCIAYEKRISVTELIRLALLQYITNNKETN